MKLTHRDIDANNKQASKVVGSLQAPVESVLEWSNFIDSSSRGVGKTVSDFLLPAQTLQTILLHFPTAQKSFSFSQLKCPTWMKNWIFPSSRTYVINNYVDVIKN